MHEGFAADEIEFNKKITPGAFSEHNTVYPLYALLENNRVNQHAAGINIFKTVSIMRPVRTVSSPFNELKTILHPMTLHL